MLEQLVSAVRHWWWMLLIAPIVAGFASYSVASRQPNLYEARSTLQVNAQGAASGDYNAIVASESLAESYREVIRTRQVLEPVAMELQLPYELDEFLANVSVNRIPNTALLVVRVSDSDPVRVARVANAIAVHFRYHIAEQAVALIAPARTALGEQIDELETRIAETRSRIDFLEQIPNTDAVRDQTELETLYAAIDQFQQALLELIAEDQAMTRDAADAQNRIMVVEQAIVPAAPYSPRISFYTLIAAFGGLLIAGLAVARFESRDTTIETSTDLATAVDAPLLGAVGKVSRMRNGPSQCFMLKQPNLPEAEAIRRLRTNILLASADQEISTLMVTSVSNGDGKSTIVANLATSIALSGSTTVILDADLRDPNQHRIFGIESNRGLWALLADPGTTFHQVAVQLQPSNLFLIPRGPFEAHLSDVLNVARVNRVLATLRESVDVVVVDTSPVLAASEVLTLAAEVDAALVVCRAQRTHSEEVGRAVSELRMAGTRMIGTVLNQTPRHDRRGH